MVWPPEGNHRFPSNPETLDFLCAVEYVWCLLSLIVGDVGPFGNQGRQNHQVRETAPRDADLCGLAYLPTVVHNLEEPQVL